MNFSGDNPVRTNKNVPIYDSDKNQSFLYAGIEKSGVNKEPENRSFAKKVLDDTGNAVKTFASDFKYIYTSPARINKRSALWLGGLVTTGGLIMVYDKEIFDAFQRNKDHKFYKPIRKAGEKFEPVGLMAEFEKYYFGALFIGYITGIDKLVEISSDFLESYCIASPGKISGNILFGRRRPREGMDPRSYKFFDGTSLPSGHSSNIVQMATVLSHHIDFLPFQIVAYGIASSVCLERITSNDHWPSDVYFGALYGRIISKTLLNRVDSRRLKITPMTIDNGNNTGFQITYKF
ncbi:phosphatase PAP2 family protein [Candidatus Latescibacterota bacterium]